MEQLLIQTRAGSFTLTISLDGTFSAVMMVFRSGGCLGRFNVHSFRFGDHVLTAAEKANFTGNASRLSKYDFFVASKYNNELIPMDLAALNLDSVALFQFKLARKRSS